MTFAAALAVLFGFIPSASGAVEAQRDETTVRAPVKILNGQRTVRVNVDVGVAVVNGRFLLDPDSPVSFVSPQWISSQGVNPRLLTLSASGRAKKLKWRDGVKLSRPVLFFGARVGGVDTGVTEFFMRDTALWGPPRKEATCCDGVLGADFFRVYRIEPFKPGDSSVVLTPLAQFKR